MRWLAPRRALVLLTILIVVGTGCAAPAVARSWHRHHDHHQSHSHHKHHDWDDDDDDNDSGDAGDSDSSDDVGDDNTGTDAVPETAGGEVLTGAEKTITAELTGYSFQDNTPPGSATISRPILHQKAGGTGTYEDPITTAVPGSGGQNMETPAGTRIYVPKIKRYVIVEDSGASKMSKTHFDIWVGGQGHSKSDSDACMDSFTGAEQVILNAGPGHPVTVGEMTESGGCKI